MKTKKLAEGVEMPVIGYGTWQLEAETCNKAVAEALEVGYRHIDTADRYGNHAQVGEAIKASGLPRADIFLTTKLWSDSLKRENVAPTVDRFLSELDTDYIDLLLIHWPNHQVPIEVTLKAMEEVKDSGKIKAIGVSNFTIHHLEDALRTGVKFANNQVEVHPTFNQKELLDFCLQNGVTLTAYSSLRAGDMELEVVRELAQKYGKSPAQIIINWIVSRGIVALPQSTNPERMKENFSALDFEIEQADIDKINDVPQKERYINPGFAEFDY